MEEVHSERESFRKALRFHTPDGAAATLLVLRRNTAVWLTFNGAERTTVAMSQAETENLIDTLRAAQAGPR